jgi:hypothetical protein
VPSKQRQWLAVGVAAAISITTVFFLTTNFLFTAGNGDPGVPPSYYPTPNGSWSSGPRATPTRSATEEASAPPSPSSSATTNPSDELDDFVRACEESTTFRQGQLSLPEEMHLRVGQSDTYSAAVDVQADPGPPDKQIDNPNPRSERIKVQCVLSARLVPVGDGIEVVPSTDAGGDGWRTLRFTPNGVVEWSWTVKPVDPVDQRLRLELVPAVKVESISRSIVVNSSADYITNVKVDATVLEKLSYWFGTQWKLLAGIAAVVGAAFLALLAFSSQAKEGFFKLFKPKNAGTAAAPPATPPEKQQKKSKKSKKSKKTP